MAEAAEKLVVNEKILFPFESYTVAVVGAGGTGSYAIPNIARIMGIMNRQYRRKDNMIIVDKDVVEEKNLARQNFISADVGKTKSRVLAERYSKAFGVDIAYCEEYINDKNAKDMLGGAGRECIILLGCVDNNKTRHILHNFFRGNASCIYIDSGNEEWGGQVVISGHTALNEDGKTIGLSRLMSYSVPSIKDVVEEFDLKPDDRHPDELSCADRALSAPQNIATNMKAADILFGYVNKILAGSANYHNSLDRNERLNEPEYGKNSAERLKNFIKRAPMIVNHIVYFDSKNDVQSGKPFSEEVQSFIRSTRRR